MDDREHAIGDLIRATRDLGTVLAMSECPMAALTATGAIHNPCAHGTTDQHARSQQAMQPTQIHDIASTDGMPHRYPGYPPPHPDTLRHMLNRPMPARESAQAAESMAEVRARDFVRPCAVVDTCGVPYVAPRNAALHGHNLRIASKFRWAADAVASSRTSPVADLRKLLMRVHSLCDKLKVRSVCARLSTGWHETCSTAHAIV